MKLVIIPLEYHEDSTIEDGYMNFYNHLTECVELKQLNHEQAHARVRMVYNACRNGLKSHIIVDADAGLDKCIVASRRFGVGNGWELSSFFINEHITNIDDFINNKKLASSENNNQALDIDSILVIISEKGFDHLTDEQKKILDDFEKKH